MGGSFATEHGLDCAKIALADALRSSVKRDLQRRIKAAFDPDCLVNPGVIIAAFDKQYLPI